MTGIGMSDDASGSVSLLKVQGRSFASELCVHRLYHMLFFSILDTFLCE